MIKVLYEDDDLLVVDKPVGLVVNKTPTFSGKTLQDFLDVTTGFDPVSEFVIRSGVVHRLDKGTSGVLLVAKTPKSFRNLQDQFKKREVKKTYVALLTGVLKESLVEIDAPIGRSPRSRFKFAVVREGKEAHTRVEKICEVEGSTLVWLYPQTGRTHQLRVHTAALGHPIVGDMVYSTKEDRKKWGTRYKRLMLHAYKISFVHPSSGNPVDFTAPVPKEFPMRQNLIQ